MWWVEVKYAIAKALNKYFPAGSVNVGLETLAPVIVFLTVVPSVLAT
jgi:hypothetical protein